MRSYECYESSLMETPFRLFESLLWEPASGYFLLDLHLERLQRSAAHFGFAMDRAQIRSELKQHGDTLPNEPRKVRLELAQSGSVHMSHQAVRPSTAVRCALTRHPISSTDPWLRHKTTRRSVYEAALAVHPEADDVLLRNERGELTETCFGNVVVELGGRRLTPRLECGLLAGTFREHLLERGELEEALIPLSALREVSALYLINSVRRWCEIDLVQPRATQSAR